MFNHINQYIKHLGYSHISNSFFDLTICNAIDNTDFMESEPAENQENAKLAVDKLTSF